MTRLLWLAVAIAAAPVFADTPRPPPLLPPPSLPRLGDDMRGHVGWPKLEWLYESPLVVDSAGKVVIHWFCTPKVQACADDLARIVTLKENSHAYIVAYISGSKADAQKLDPIRGSEGVRAGTVAYGKGVTSLMRDFGVAPGPTSIVEDVDGKVAYILSNGSPEQLDARDAKVNTLVAAVKPFTSSSDGPKSAKPGDKFQLTLAIKLASWLAYGNKSAMEFKLTVPPDVKCDATALKGDQLKIDNRTLTASVTCTAVKGIYEARGEIRFGYDTQTGATGIGNDSAKWKFDVMP